MKFSEGPSVKLFPLPNAQIFLIWRDTLKKKLSRKALTGLIALSFAAFSMTAAAVDEEAAKALARQNNCLKCHGVTKQKDGPSYKAVADEYRGRPDAEMHVIEHITTGKKAKFPDGHEEEHKIVKTDPPKDMAQIKNLAQWILSN